MNCIDGINNILVKLSATVVVRFLKHLINISFAAGIFPEKLKYAKVLPLHKGGSKLEENNYRPISLLVIWSKIYERAMSKRVYNFFESCNLLSNCQVGFRSKHCTIDALVELTENVRQKCNVKSIHCFFLDLRKAFDTIDHIILLQKLDSYGVRSKALDCFKSYLTNRQQRVEVNGVISKWQSVKYGVPQGSILGPLLFLIYINDLPLRCTNSKSLLFADDTNLTFIDVESEVVQKELSEVKDWLAANKLSLNVNKTVQMNVKQNAIDNVFLIDNSTINVQPVCKYLGVFVDNKLSFVSHVQYVTSRLSKQCGIMAKLRHFAPDLI